MSRSSPPTRKLTYEDFLKFPDDGLRHELIDGEHHVSPSPVPLHQRVVVRLVISLGGFAAQSGCGQLLVSPVDVVLSPHDVVVPDVILFSPERQHLIGEKNVAGPPDLAIEVLSPSSRSRDHVLKRHLYERAGVGEYWIMDPKRATATVYRAAAGAYGHAEQLSAARGEALSSPLAPGWSLPLPDLFA